MKKEIIVSVDFNNNTIKEDHYFNLTELELLDLKKCVPEGLDQYIIKAQETENSEQILNVIKILVDASYGIKSEDGKRHMKSDAILESFKQSSAYSTFVMELLSDDVRFNNFVLGVLPGKVLAMVKQQEAIASNTTITGAGTVIELPVQEPQTVEQNQPITPVQFAQYVESHPELYNANHNH